MKRLITLIFISMMCSLTFGQLDHLNLDGQGGFGAAQAFTREQVGSTYYWTITKSATSTLTTPTFLFSNYTYGNKWGGKTITKNSINTYNWGTSGITDNTISNGITSGYTYTFRFKDNGYANSDAILMETVNAPVTFTACSQVPASNAVTPGNSVTINFTIRGTKSSQEMFYVRYTTDNWTNSSFTSAATLISENDYSATLPAQSAGTVVKYYVLSTTYSSAPTHSVANIIKLNESGNQTSPYSYTVNSFSIFVTGQFNGAGGANGTTLAATSEVINSLTYWYVNNVTATQTVNPNSTFMFTTTNNGNYWGGATANKNTITSHTWGTTTSSNTISDGVTSGRHYTFRFQKASTNSGLATSNAIVMETDNSPVALTYGSQSPSSGPMTTNDGVTVNFTISTTKSTQEIFYIRYTTDGWVSSQFLTATGSGTSYSAQFPRFPITTTVSYYILSTTFTGTPTHANADLIKLNEVNNGGSNYSFTVSTFILDVIGQINGTGGANGAPLATTSDVTNSITYHTVTCLATQTVGTSSTFIFGDYNQSRVWGNITAAKNTINNYVYGTTGISNNNITGGITSGKYYTFRIKDNNAYANSDAIVMETDNAPVTLTYGAQSPVGSSVTTNDAVTITFTTSANASPQEMFYVRYTTDNFTNSNYVLATNVSGSNYTATLPRFVDGTNVKYYILSTTYTGTATHAIADIIKLNLLNNSGSNYSFSVTFSLDVIGQVNGTGGANGIPLFATRETMGAYNYWTVTSLSTQSVASNSTFMFGDYTQNRKWGGATTADINTINTYTYGSSTLNQITGGITINKYYTFRLKENLYNNTTGIVMVTDNPPVTIAYSGQSPIAASVTTNDAVVVNFTISGSASSQEMFYVRYTTDAWSTSNYLVATPTGVGFGYSATLPRFVSNTTVSYYIFSTTYTTAPVVATVDLIKLNSATNSGSNYSFTVAFSLDVIGQVNGTSNANGIPLFATSETIRSAKYWTITSKATQTVATTSTFMFGDYSLAKKWGNITSAISTVSTYVYGNSTLNNITGGITLDKYYTFRFKDIGDNSTSALVMETDATPVTLTYGSQTPNASSVTNNDNVTINFSISTAKSAQEKFYVRYTTDSWTTSSFALASLVSGNDYSATIPYQVPGTITYYILSTALAVAPTHAVGDLIKLNVADNGGVGYSYNVTNNGLTTYNTPSMGSGLTGWRANELLESILNRDYYFTWDNNYLYFAFSGSNGANYGNNDRFNIGIDVDPSGSSGSINAFSGINCTQGIQKPDYMIQLYALISGGQAVLWKNSSGTWTDAGTINSLAGGTNEYRSGTDVKIRVPISVLTGATGVSAYSPSNPIQIWMSEANNNDKPFSVMPSSNPQGDGSAVISVYNVRKYSSLGSGMNPKTDFTTSALPVELTSFTYSISSKSVILNWKTATELNNYGFEIEKRTIGNFEKIGFIQGSGNTNSPKNYSFSDENTLGLSKIAYRLKQIDNDGKFTYSDEINVDLTPKNFALTQNYPNPFNPSTILSFSLPSESVVSLKIYNVLGEVIREVINSVKSAGVHQVSIDATNMSTGIYFYNITCQSIDGKTNFTQTKKMILNK